MSHQNAVSKISAAGENFCANYFAIPGRFSCAASSSRRFFITFSSACNRKRAKTILPPNASARQSLGVLLSMHKYPPWALNFADADADFHRALMHLRFVPELFRCKREMKANIRAVW